MSFTGRTTPIILLIAVGLVWSAAAARSGDPVPETAPVSEAELIEQILELRQKMEALLAGLPPEARQEVERRWAAIEAGRIEIAGDLAPDADSEPSAGETSTGGTETVENKGDVGGSEVVSPGDTQPDRIELVTERLPVAETVDVPVLGSAEEKVAGPSCNTLEVFDSNQDGKISGADRYWRHLRLWRDNGDDAVAAEETSTPFDLGIREIDVRLQAFTNRDGVDGGIWVEDLIRFDSPGTGGESGARALVIDVDGLARGGEYRLVDRSGEPLAGVQALRKGIAAERVGGERTLFLCD